MKKTLEERDECGEISRKERSCVVISRVEEEGEEGRPLKLFNKR